MLSSQAVPCKPPQGAQSTGTEHSPLNRNPSRADSTPWLPVVRSAPSAKTFASAVHVRHQARGPQIWLSFAPWGPDPGWPGPPWQLLSLQDKSVGAKRDRAWDVPQLENVSLCTSPSHSVRLSKLAASQAALPPRLCHRQVLNPKSAPLLQPPAALGHRVLCLRLSQEPEGEVDSQPVPCAQPLIYSHDLLPHVDHTGRQDSWQPVEYHMVPCCRLRRDTQLIAASCKRQESALHTALCLRHYVRWQEEDREGAGEAA